MRGDANGRIALWRIPDTPECASMQLKKVSAFLKKSLFLEISHVLHACVRFDEFLGLNTYNSQIFEIHKRHE